MKKSTFIFFLLGFCCSPLETFGYNEWPGINNECTELCQKVLKSYSAEQKTDFQKHLGQFIEKNFIPPLFGKQKIKPTTKTSTIVNQIGFPLLSFLSKAQDKIQIFDKLKAEISNLPNAVYLEPLKRLQIARDAFQIGTYSHTTAKIAVAVFREKEKEKLDRVIESLWDKRHQFYLKFFQELDSLSEPSTENLEETIKKYHPSFQTQSASTPLSHKKNKKGKDKSSSRQVLVDSIKNWCAQDFQNRSHSVTLLEKRIEKLTQSVYDRPIQNLQEAQQLLREHHAQGAHDVQNTEQKQIEEVIQSLQKKKGEFCQNFLSQLDKSGFSLREEDLENLFKSLQEAKNIYPIEYDDPVFMKRLQRFCDMSIEDHAQFFDDLQKLIQPENTPQGRDARRRSEIQAHDALKIIEEHLSPFTLDNLKSLEIARPFESYETDHLRRFCQLSSETRQKLNEIWLNHQATEETTRLLFNTFLVQDGDFQGFFKKLLNVAEKNKWSLTPETLENFFSFFHRFTQEVQPTLRCHKYERTCEDGLDCLVQLFQCSSFIQNTFISGCRELFPSTNNNTEHKIWLMKKLTHLLSNPLEQPFECVLNHGGNLIKHPLHGLHPVMQRFGLAHSRFSLKVPQGIYASKVRQLFYPPVSTIRNTLVTEARELLWADTWITNKTDQEILLMWDLKCKDRPEFAYFMNPSSTPLNPGPRVFYVPYEQLHTERYQQQPLPLYTFFYMPRDLIREACQYRQQNPNVPFNQLQQILEGQGLPNITPHTLQALHTRGQSVHGQTKEGKNRDDRAAKILSDFFQEQPSLPKETVEKLIDEFKAHLNAYAQKDSLVFQKAQQMLELDSTSKKEVFPALLKCPHLIFGRVKQKGEALIAHLWHFITENTQGKSDQEKDQSKQELIVALSKGIDEGGIRMCDAGICQELIRTVLAKADQLEDLDGSPSQASDDFLQKGKIRALKDPQHIKQEAETYCVELFANRLKDKNSEQQKAFKAEFMQEINDYIRLQDLEEDEARDMAAQPGPSKKMRME